MEGNRLIYDYYKRQAMTGMGISRYYRASRRFQSGSGIGSILSSVLRFALPIAKKTGKYLAKRTLNTLGGMAHDILEGESPKQATKRRAESMFENIQTDARSKLSKMLNSTPPRKQTKLSTPRRPVKKHKTKKRRGGRSDNFGIL